MGEGGEGLPFFMGAIISLLKYLPQILNVVGIIKTVYSFIKKWRYNRKKKKINEAETPGDIEKII